MYVDACECMLMHVRDGLYDKQAGEIRKIAIPSKLNIKFYAFQVLTLIKTSIE